MSDNDDNDESKDIVKPLGDLKTLKPEKKKKRGLIYLSTIPRYMNVTMIREIFSAYGEVGRVYLQLAEHELAEKIKGKKRRKPARHYTEGWVEFEKQKVAKFVAEKLNCTQVSNRKKSKFYDILWNIKFLPGFKWIHLTERLAYERAIRKKRMQMEISQAKKEVNYYSYNVDRSKKLKKKADQGENGFELSNIKMRETDEQIRKKKNPEGEADRTAFLKTLFG